MAETFYRPGRQTLIAQAKDELAQRLGLGPLLPNSVLEAFATVQAGLAHLLHGHLDFLSRQITPLTSEGEFLTRHAEEYGLQRKAATFATGSLDFTGTEGTLLPSGTLVRRVDGFEYRTTANGTVAGGTVTVPADAEVAGEDGDAAAAQVVTLASPIAGITTQGAVATGGMTGGADEETDADLLARLLQRKRNPPQGGAVADYVAWALEVGEVTRAWAIESHLGIGTVGVTFVVDNDPASIIPGAAKVQEVQDYIDDPTRRPVTADVTVFAPGTVALDPDISLTPNDAAVQQAVEAALEDMIRRETSPGGTILLSRIREAISTAEGEVDHVLNSPVADVVAAAGQIHVLGTITWS